MDRGHDPAPVPRFDDLPSVACDAEGRTQEGAGGGRAEGDHQGGLDGRDLGREPRFACGDLRGIGLLVDAAFPAGLPLEVFDCVGDVHGRAVDTGFGQRFVEETSRGPDERAAFEILLVPGLFSHKHHTRGPRALAEDRLRGVLPEVAGAAPGRGGAKPLEGRPRGRGHFPLRGTHVGNRQQWPCQRAERPRRQQAAAVVVRRSRAGEPSASPQIDAIERGRE